MGQLEFSAGIVAGPPAGAGSASIPQAKSLLWLSAKGEWSIRATVGRWPATLAVIVCRGHFSIRNARYFPIATPLSSRLCTASCHHRIKEAPCRCLAERGFTSHREDAFRKSAGTKTRTSPPPGERCQHAWDGTSSRCFRISIDRILALCPKVLAKTIRINSQGPPP